jgi:uncharacterized protein (TIGR02265 family)
LEYDPVLFGEPAWNEPIDFAARVAATPKDAAVRGMFLALLVRSLSPEVASKRVVRRYIPFKNYPMREYIELLELSSINARPRLPPAEHVRRLGHTVYPNYAASLTGMAIFAVAGRSFRRVLELSPAAYRIASEEADVKIVSITDGKALIELRNLWNLPDLHQVGVFEGAMHVCNAQGMIRTQVLSHSDVDLEITWSEAKA